MKEQLLKLANVKSDKEFYKLYPNTQEGENAFMAKFGKIVKKLQMKEGIKKAQMGLNQTALNSFNQGMGIVNQQGFNIPEEEINQEAFNTSGQNPYAPTYNKIPQLTGDPSYGTNTQVNPQLQQQGQFIQQPKEKNKTDWAKGVPLVGKLFAAGQALHDEKDALREAQKWEGVSDIALQASQTQDVDFNRMNKQMQWRPEDNTISGNQLYNPYGQGTNVLARKGGKIPKAQWGQMLQGLGGAKSIGGTGKFAQGFQQFAGAGGVDTISKGISSLTGENAGGDMGGAIGGTIGSIFGPIGSAVGQIGGQTIGTLLDKNPKKIKAANNETYSNINQMAFGQGMKGMQQQNNSFMRTGGNIRQNNIPDLQLYEGGVEQVSPDTIKFTGDSHADGGQDITYGGNPVEVEGNEYASEMPDAKTGEDNLVVFGNLINPLTNRKFKKDAGELAKAEEKQTNVVKKATEKIGGIDVNTPHDKLAFTSLKLMNLGANMKLKALADEKNTLAAMQSALNDTAEEYSLDADNLSKGNIETAKLGASITKAQSGNWFPKKEEIEYFTNSQDPRFIINSFPEDFSKLEVPKLQGFNKNQLYKVNSSKNINSTSVSNKKSSKNNNSERNNQIETVSNEVYNPIRKVFLPGTSNPTELPEYKKPINTKNDYSYIDTTPYHQPVSKGFINPPSKYDLEHPTTTNESTLNPWITGINSMIPLIRPSDAEQLDPRQLAGEMYAMSTNQLEPVQAQTYNPQLGTPYDISLQDILNENQATTRGAQRMMGYNPAAQSAIVAQQYGANEKVLGEQFRLNQNMKGTIYDQNRNTLNDAQLKNIGIYDNQYQRQSEAKSNTKALTQAALNSISDKFMKNKLENRALAVNENMYNYRFDRRGRAWNWNPLAQFDTSMGGKSTGKGKISDIPDDWMTLYDENGKFQGTKKRTKATEETKNGGIVRAIKNL